MDEICVAKFDVYECRKSDRASALSGAQLIICAAQTPEFPDTIPTIHRQWFLHQQDRISTAMEMVIHRQSWEDSDLHIRPARQANTFPQG